MIWLTWRQFRVQFLVAAGGLAAVTVYLVILGLRIRHTYDINVNCGADCTVSGARDALEAVYANPLMLSGFLVLLVPALIGAFWGAPLIAREFETGTHRLVWSQSITRTHWLVAKLGLITLAGVAVTGALSLLLTWAASPYDQLLTDRFEPLVFPTRNIVPLAYAAFAIAAGIAIGLVTRRTVPAIAITLAAFAGLQILLPNVIRPHLQAPVVETATINADMGIQHFGVGPGENDGVSVGGYTNVIPGSWILSGETPLLDAAGAPATREQIRPCLGGGNPEKAMACLAEQNFHITVSYQPAERYWTFQWLESMAYLILAGLLVGFVFWRIPRGLA